MTEANRNVRGGHSVESVTVSWEPLEETQERTEYEVNDYFVRVGLGYFSGPDTVRVIHPPSISAQ